MRILEKSSEAGGGVVKFYQRVPDADNICTLARGISGLALERPLQFEQELEELMLFLYSEALLARCQEHDSCRCVRDDGCNPNRSVASMHRMKH